MKLRGAEEAVTQHYADSRQSLIKHNTAMMQVAKSRNEVAVYDVMIEDAEAAMEKAEAAAKTAFEEAEAAALEASFDTTNEDLMALHIPVDEVAAA